GRGAVDFPVGGAGPAGWLGAAHVRAGTALVPLELTSTRGARGRTQARAQETIMGSVISIIHTPEGVEPRPPDRYARVPLEAATLVAGCGSEGDRKGTGLKRQLNVMAAETLAQLHAEGFRTCSPMWP